MVFFALQSVVEKRAVAGITTQGEVKIIDGIEAKP